MNKMICIAMLLAKKSGYAYGLHYVFSTGEWEILRCDENNKEGLTVLILYRCGYADYKYDEELLKEGWRIIKDDHSSGYWLIKE